MALEREIDVNTYNALLGVFHPVVMAKIDWPDGVVYAHNNIGTIVWGGNSWLGLGQLASVSIPDEGSSLIASEASMSLAGYLEDLLDITDANSRNRLITLYIGLTTEAGGTTLVGDPIESFAGYLDENEFSDSAAGVNRVHSLSFGISSGPSARARASINHTYEDQTSRYPSDELFRHVIFARSRVSNPAIFPEP